MGAEDVRIEPNARNPVGDEPCVLSRGHATSLIMLASEQEFSGLLACNFHVVVDSLAGQLRQFELDGLTGLSLSHRSPVDSIPAGCNVLDFERNHIAATQFAVDGQI